MDNFETLTVKHGASVAEITFNRPELLNRFDDVMQVELVEALDSVRRDRDVRAVLLASTGKTFSSGGDLEVLMECHRHLPQRLRLVDDGRRLLAALLDIPQPIVVALHGDAVALGATVALACDAIVAVRSAFLSDPHVNVGLVAGDGGCLVWPQSIGMLWAKRFLLTGDRLSAEEAYKLGMVTDLVDSPEQVLPVARALAERIAALPPLAVQGTKRALNRVLQHRASEVIDLSFAHEVTSFESTDVIEAVGAIRERRAPIYRGE